MCMVDETPGRGGRFCRHWKADLQTNQGGWNIQNTRNYFIAICFSFFYDYFIGHDIRNPSLTNKKEFMVVKPLDDP